MSNENDSFNDGLLYWNETTSDSAADSRSQLHDARQRPSGVFAGGDSSQVQETLKGWIADALEAARPPKHLRGVLSHECWRPTTFPGVNILLQALRRTGGFAPEAERTKPSVKKKNRVLLPPQHFQENEIACFACADAETTDALPATMWLTQLAPTTRAVLVLDGDKWYGFFGAQLKALREYQQKQATERNAEREEARRLELLAGQGSVEEFLAMPVKVKTRFDLDYGYAQFGSASARVFSAYTAGYQGYVHEPETLTMRALLTRLAERADYDGIEFNPPGFGDKPIAIFGPNFARRLLLGDDARGETACPARAAREFKMGEWWTRFGVPADAVMKERVGALIAQAQRLLAAIPPGQDALPREAVQSVEGALYLRCQPRYGQRQWLEWFLRRCERALHARWRVGIF